MIMPRVSQTIKGKIRAELCATDANTMQRVHMLTLLPSTWGEKNRNAIDEIVDFIDEQPRTKQECLDHFARIKHKYI